MTQRQFPRMDADYLDGLSSEQVAELVALHRAIRQGRFPGLDADALFDAWLDAHRTHTDRDLSNPNESSAPLPRAQTESALDPFGSRRSPERRLPPEFHSAQRGA
jgi:hypothetical protein